MATLNKFVLLFLTIILFSCDDIFEEDITDDTLLVTSPLEGDIIESNVVNFKWETLEGATKYRVEVYDGTEDKILDTLITNKTNLVYPIAQGVYKWKARAENFAYQSKYSVLNNFSVVETLDLTNQQVILKSPLDNFYTNASSVNCLWKDLAAADTYDFELLNATSGSSVLQQSGITDLSYSINTTNLSSEAKYQWKVKGVNATSETQSVSSRFFYIDRTVPVPPQITSPNNNATFSIANGQTSVSVEFKWNLNQADTGIIQSPIVSRIIEFSSTNSFSNITSSATMTGDTFIKSFSSSETGDHYWRIKAVDAATNIGEYSAVLKFTVN